MEINYTIEVTDVVTLKVVDFSELLMQRIRTESSVIFGDDYKLCLYNSGASRMESDFGQTIIYVGKVWEAQQSVLKGYVKEDIDTYIERVSGVFELASPLLVKPEVTENKDEYIAKLEDYVEVIETKLNIAETKLDDAGLTIEPQI